MMVQEELRCKECGREIFDPYKKTQQYCSVLSGRDCSKRRYNREYGRRKNKTKPENYYGRYNV